MEISNYYRISVIWKVTNIIQLTISSRVKELSRVTNALIILTIQKLNGHPRLVLANHPWR